MGPRFGSAWPTACLALVLALALPAAGSTDQRSPVPRLKLSYRELVATNSTVTLSVPADVWDFRTLLLDEDRGRLLVGTRNYLLLLQLDNINRQPRKIYWPPSKERVEICKLTGKDPQRECANFVRALHHYNRTHVYACGTGAFYPVCAFVHMGSRLEEPVFSLDAQHMESGRGRCPYDPQQHTVSLITDGQLFAGLNVDFMGKEPTFGRSLGPGNSIRTEQHEASWLNDPKFVAVFAFPDTSSREDDKVYVFFRETALEASGAKAIYSRVARVCKNDMGGQRSLINKWTTFLKARLVCSVPGPNGIDTHFDEIQDVFLQPTKDDRNPLLYAVFSTSSAVFQGSAVCVYHAADVRAVFNGPFAHKEGQEFGWTEYKGKVPYPRPGTCPSRTYDPSFRSTRELPDEVVHFARSHTLMARAVAPALGRPVFTLTSAEYALTRIVAHHVQAEDGPYDVLFLGTSVGSVLKVITIPTKNLAMEDVILEELSLAKEPSPVLSMVISPKRQQLLVGLQEGLVQLSFQRCHVYGKACAECCLSRDPYCAWDGTACSRYFPSNKSLRRARRQDVRHGDPTTHCWDTHGGEFEESEEKVLFGVEGNATFLECVPPSRLAALSWYVQHSKKDPPQELKTDERIVQTAQGLLVRDLHRGDAGVYRCRARENAYSREVSRVALHVVPGEGLRADGAAARGPPRGAADDDRRRPPNAAAAGLPPSLPPAFPAAPRKDAYLRPLPDGGVEELCEQLWLKRPKPRFRGASVAGKWKHPQDSGRGRMRRHPGTGRQGAADVGARTGR
uniref:Semaphorin-3D-like isoform X2 n=1 Tax=Petromyzon marinus TaxID=7757 RepID=A0AAJ7TQW8_PETMA|nr:semaphorin-3D-like isoform X2 [Petromyzon marinus]